MVDTVLFGEDIGRYNPGGVIVRDKLFEGSPSTEDILEEEVGENLASLRGDSSAFRIRHERTLGVEDVAILPELRHKEGVSMGFTEQRRDVRD